MSITEEIILLIKSNMYRASAKSIQISTKDIIEQIESTKALAVLKCEEIAALREWAHGRTVPV